ncbi:Uncharacterised protein [Mycobacteroides abscessus subsp. abscessus]|nr:Uncharacterised protein [Mycobacteroides abscessus subsp. abscessus]
MIADSALALAAIFARRIRHTSRPESPRSMWYWRMASRPATRCGSVVASSHAIET